MQSINRMADILNCLTTADGLGVSDVARQTGLNKATAHRILNAMCDLRMVIQYQDTLRYVLGTQMMTWGAGYITQQEPSDLLRKYCQQIALQTQFFCYLAYFDGQQAYCITSYQPAQERNSYFVRVGQRMPLHSSACTKAILAFQMDIDPIIDHCDYVKYTENTIQTPAAFRKELAQVKKEGIAYCFEELDPNAAAISVPIVENKNQVRYSISVIGNIEQIHKKKAQVITMMKELSLQAAQEINAYNQYQPYICKPQ